jgi:hypothetical protein
VALVSLLTGQRVPPNVAMTGEITLRGLVLPVGGIKEKVGPALPFITFCDEVAAYPKRYIRLHLAISGTSCGEELSSACQSQRSSSCPSLPSGGFP